MKMFYEEDRATDIGIRGVAKRDHSHDTDAYNLRLLKNDARLRRLVRAYFLADEAGRVALAQSADALLQEIEESQEMT